MCRVVRKTFSYPENRSQAFYDVELELSPIASRPSGAYSRFTPSTTNGGVPVLPRATTPGNLLVAVIVGQANASDHAFSSGASFYDDPPLPFSPIPPYASTLWTVLVNESIWTGSQNIGPPGAIQFSIAYRFVQPGETTTRPMAGVAGIQSPSGASSDSGVWLWEFPTRTAPTLATGFTTDATLGSTVTVGSPLSGFVFGGFACGIVDYAGDPAIVDVTGVAVRNCSQSNDPTLFFPNPGNGWSPRGEVSWVHLAALAGGGTLTATINDVDAYNHIMVAGGAIVIPGISSVPDIPYPANQTA